MKGILKQLLILFAFVTALQSIQAAQLTGAPVTSALDNEQTESKDCQVAFCSASFQKKLGMCVYFGTLVGLGILIVIIISSESRQLPTESISSNLSECLSTNESMIQIDSSITKGLNKTNLSIIKDGTVFEGYHGVSPTGVVTDVMAAKGPSINMVHVTKEFISENVKSEVFKGAVEEILSGETGLFSNNPSIKTFKAEVLISPKAN